MGAGTPQQPSFAYLYTRIQYNREHEQTTVTHNKHQYIKQKTDMSRGSQEASKDCGYFLFPKTIDN